MRKDMQKLIIKGHSRPKSNRGKSGVRDIENLPERERMRDGYHWREFPRDRLNPLWNFLKNNVGRRWDKVYAEICAVTDSRSFEGKHLLDHVNSMVISEEQLIATRSHRWRNHYWELYYDTNGILRQFKEDGYKRHTEYNPDECVINGRPYTRVNGCWFEASYHEIQEPRTELDFVTWQRVVRYYAKTVVRKVRQLNTKELKSLGLSNEPGWKWYE